MYLLIELEIYQIPHFPAIHSPGDLGKLRYEEEHEDADEEAGGLVRAVPALLLPLGLSLPSLQSGRLGGCLHAGSKVAQYEIDMDVKEEENCKNLLKKVYSLAILAISFLTRSLQSLRFWSLTEGTNNNKQQIH